MTWRKLLTLPGLELRHLGRPARSQSLYRLSYPGTWLDCEYAVLHMYIHCCRFYIINTTLSLKLTGGSSCQYDVKWTIWASHAMAAKHTSLRDLTSLKVTFCFLARHILRLCIRRQFSTPNRRYASTRLYGSHIPEYMTSRSHGNKLSGYVRSRTFLTSKEVYYLILAVTWDS
jgi:hypothetical protein